MDANAREESSQQLAPIGVHSRFSLLSKILRGTKVGAAPQNPLAIWHWFCLYCTVQQLIDGGREQRGNMNVKRIVSIISLLAIAAILSAPSVMAEDTNVIPSLTIAGETFTNVEMGTVTGSRVTIFYDGGGKRVAMSNLPPFLQKRLNFDPEAARAADEAEAERKVAAKERADKEAEELAKAQTALGPAQKLRLVKVLPDTYVQIEAEGATSEAYIHNLPPEILTLLRDYQNAEGEVTNLEAQLSKVPGAPGGNRGRMSRQAAQQQASTAAANNSYRTNIQTALTSAKGRCNTLKTQLGTRAVISARPRSFFLYPHARVWEYQSASVTAAAQ